MAALEAATQSASVCELNYVCANFKMESFAAPTHGGWVTGSSPVMENIGV